MSTPRPMEATKAAVSLMCRSQRNAFVFWDRAGREFSSRFCVVRTARVLTSVRRGMGMRIPRIISASRAITGSYKRIYLSSWSKGSDRHHWSEEWKQLGLGAKLVDEPAVPEHLFFVQMGFGVDQHGDNDATKAAVRAVRNAIEFNSIPGVISHLPGGRSEMLIHVKLGVPTIEDTDDSASIDSMEIKAGLLPVDLLQVAKVFPYGTLLPIQVTLGGLSFATGRVVPELGDTNDMGICVAACVSLGYGHGSTRTTYNTQDGF